MTFLFPVSLFILNQYVNIRQRKTWPKSLEFSNHFWPKHLSILSFNWVSLYYERLDVVGIRTQASKRWIVNKRGHTMYRHWFLLWAPKIITYYLNGHWTSFHKQVWVISISYLETHFSFFVNQYMKLGYSNTSKRKNVSILFVT